MTGSAGGVRPALDPLADLRTSPVSVEEALDRVVASADALFGVDGTVLMLVDRGQVLRNLAVSDSRAALLGGLQAEHEEGPCVDAFDDKEPVAADDLSREDRWPAFSPDAARPDLLAVLARTIPYSEQAVGVGEVVAPAPPPRPRPAVPCRPCWPAPSPTASRRSGWWRCSRPSPPPGPGPSGRRL